MTDTIQRRRNGALWAGGILTVIAVLSQGMFFLNMAGQRIIPWLNLLLAAIAVVYFVIGLRRSYTQPQTYRGKIAGSIFGTISVALLGLTVWGFLHARDMPASAGAPKVGEKAPEFTLTDTNGQPVSLTQLLTTSPGNSSQGAHPRAVLLVFYRGYW